jgi:hypothetical protein
MSDVLWGWPLIALLVGTHIFLTFRLKFIQRYMFQAIKISFSRKREGEGDISQFGALTTALAATIGTGNIVGVATAVAAGGPGAVLWMWLTGVFGIATKYSEAVLSLKYRITNKDRSSGIRDRQHGTGQFDCVTGAGNLPCFTMDHRADADRADSSRYPRRHQIHRESLRKTGTFYGSLLFLWLFDFIGHAL